MEKHEKNMRTQTKSKKNDEQKLIDICSYIFSNYDTLSQEFKQIEQILTNAEVCGAAYLNRNMIAMHLKSQFDIDMTFETLKSILDNLDRIKENASKEFVQYVDFLNICKVILDENAKDNVVRFVWNAKKTLHYITYQIARINTAEQMAKKVSILKGMIAYY